MNERWRESNQAVVEVLRAEIKRAGRMPFAQFMETALYHPGHGYYVAGATRPGRAGDFLTAPEAHPIFGHALARQLDEMWRLLDRPAPFTFREYGSGAGTLAHDILAGLRADGSALLDAIRYQPVEVNPQRRAELEARLDAAGFRDRLAEPVPGELITGCVLANEFVDAFPVHRVAVHDGTLQEVYVTWRDGWFAEELGPPSTPDLAARFAREGVALTEGQRAEVNLAVDAWMAEVAAALRQGYMVVIDYGYPATELYGPDRRGGTLKAYDQHTVHEDPYRAVGEQDLTAHVDFTALEQAAQAHGLTVLGLTTQAEFLAGAGIGELLVAMQQQDGMTLERYLGARAAVTRMIDPGAMGRFRVLILGRAVPAEPRLCGLRTTM